MNKNDFGCMLYSIFFAIIAVIVHFLTIWTQINIEWAIMKSGHGTVQVNYFLALAITLVGNGFTVAFNLISEVLKLFL